MRAPAPLRPLLLVALGAALGAAAAALQVRVLRYGALTPGQLSTLRLAFVGLGAAFCLAGGMTGERRGLRPFVVRAIVLPVLALGVVVLLNRRPLPDVYLLVTDTTRADHLSLYGYERETTPFLEELARRSVVFQNGIAQGTHTIVSTPSLLASVYPSEHGMRSYEDVLPTDWKLISEHLSEVGYHTYGYVTNPHLGPHNGFARGFDRYEHSPSWKHIPAAGVNRSLLAWMDERHRRPAFAFLFYIDPHNPYRPPEPWSRRFDPGWTGAPITDWDHERMPPGEEEHRNLVAQYDGAIAYWDSELRALVREIRRRSGLGNAMLIYTSDHGEEFWEHGFWGHNKAPYDGLVRVPLLISFPVPVRFPPMAPVSGSVEEIVSGVDLLPTVLEYLRLPTAGGLAGRSALSLVFGGEQGPPRVAFCEQILTEYGPYDIRGIRTGAEKYVRVLRFEGEERDQELLFDLRRDPAEQEDLAARQPGRVAALREMLEAHGLRRREPATDGQRTVPDPEAIERLRSLGYVGN